MQISFDPLTYLDNGTCATMADAVSRAKTERNIELAIRKKNGEKVSGFRLTGQLRQYAGFGQPDGRVRTVYYVQTA